MNNIWIFKEPRSGSTWITNELFYKIDRMPYHYDRKHEVTENNQQAIIDNFLKVQKDLKNPEYFYATHHFFLLPYLELSDDTLLIRTARRDKTDQCMSLLYFSIYKNGLHHFYKDHTKNYSIKHFSTTLDKPIIVSKKQVLSEMDKIKKRDEMWEKYSKSFDNHVIVYEDLFDGINIPKLNISLSFDDNKDFTLKTPEYKTKAFLNYDDIVSWCNDYINTIGFMRL